MYFLSARIFLSLVHGGFRCGAIEIKFGVLSASEIAKHARRIERKRDSRAACAVCAA